MKKKKVQAVAEEETVKMNGLCIGSLDACVVCDCCPVGVDCNRCPAGSIYDNDTMEPVWTTVSSISSKKVFAQTTAACSGALLGARAHLGSNPSGMPRGSNRFGVLQGDGDDSSDDCNYSSENYAGFIADVGAGSFASDKVLYAEKARKQRE